MSIAVVIGTYGSEEWADLAMSQAYQSALRNEAAQIYHVHGETLAKARNEGARQARMAAYDFLCFLDADDELGPEFIDAMGRAIGIGFRRKDLLYTPAVQWIHGRKEYAPRFMPEVDYRDGNWLVIGTVVPTDLFWKVGGFEEFPLYEDWALFARMQKAGATPIKVSEAVYRAYRRAGSRNHPAGGRRAKLAAHDEIRRTVFPELYEEVA